ncbi:hypothetical protein KKH56_03240, partial [bacterium]|nr:hypothetical protein [bacterium]
MTRAREAILFAITILILIPGIGMSQEVTWVKYPAHIDLGTECQVSHPSVVFDGNKYHLWYVSQSGAQRSINYARSTDGITYEAYPGNPVLQDGIGEVWDGEWVSQPSVVYDGTTFQMWYSGYDGNTLRIGYATSTDGVSWNKDAANPVLDLGTSGSFDDGGVSSPSVLYDGTVYHMWYTGYDGTNMRIGYATSTDGVAWNKYAGNPVLDPGASGDWDDAGVSSPGVLHDRT